MKKVILKVDNSRVQDSIESAYLKITSPSGKSIELKKHWLTHATDEQRDCFWKFCKNPMIRFVGDMEATKEEMQILLDFSKIKN